MAARFPGSHSERGTLAAESGANSNAYRVIPPQLLPLLPNYAKSAGEFAVNRAKLTTSDGPGG